MLIIFSGWSKIRLWRWWIRIFLGEFKWFQGFFELADFDGEVWVARNSFPKLPERFCALSGACDDLALEPELLAVP